MNERGTAALLLFGMAGLLFGCVERQASSSLQSAAVGGIAQAFADHELSACEAERDAILAEPAVEQGFAYATQRPLFLGRIRGRAPLFLRAPTESAPSKPAARQAFERFERDPPGYRVRRLVAALRHDRESLRAILLPEGYAFADDAVDAFELSDHVALTDLFDEPRIVLERAEERFLLVRSGSGRNARYVHAEGPRAGSGEVLEIGDRVTIGGDSGPASTRDVLGFADRIGFDRLRIGHLTEGGLVAEARFGSTWVTLAVRAEGAGFGEPCLVADRSHRAQVQSELEALAPIRAATGRLRAAVTDLVDDALPFDRPRDEDNHDRDGMLRPYWLSAYLGGRQTFTVEEATYPVYSSEGQPRPPEVCVDFVVDAFERAGGSWYRPRGETPGRSAGRLDFASLGSGNRRAVLGFAAFAEGAPEHFEVLTWPAGERVAFANREAFFESLVEHADRVRPGDVVAIRGLKRDDRVHQHAILVERTDPLTGMPFGLADQMKRPRRRSWESIMAEAPKRMLEYRVRLQGPVLARLAEPADPLSASPP